MNFMAYSVSLSDFDHYNYRRTATGEFPECNEVYSDETPWTIPEIRR